MKLWANDEQIGEGRRVCHHRIFAMFFGLVLIAANTVPGVGVTAVWFAALFGSLGGFFLIYRALQQRKA